MATWVDSDESAVDEEQTDLVLMANTNYASRSNTCIDVFSNLTQFDLINFIIDFLNRNQKLPLKLNSLMKVNANLTNEINALKTKSVEVQYENKYLKDTLFSKPLENITCNSHKYKEVF